MFQRAADVTDEHWVYSLTNDILGNSYRFIKDNSFPTMVFPNVRALQQKIITSVISQIKNM